MSLLATLLLASQPVPAATDEPDIVVVARRLDSVRVNVGQGPDGKWYCGMDGSSGVLSLDKKLCKAVTECVRKGAASDRTIDACVRNTKSRLLKKFAKQRRKRR